MILPCVPDFPCYNGQAFPPARRFFRGIEETAQKRLSNRWLLYASYLYSRLNGNFDGSFRAVGGFNKKDPNITDDFDYPEFVVNSDGRLTLDRPHQVKVQAAYVFPFNLTASVSGYYLSGTPLSQIGWWDGYGAEEDDEEAIRWANDVDYGLSASVSTSNVNRALNAARRLRFGTVWINDHLPLVSEMPHGGYRQSAYGKDMSMYALEDYSQVKHVMARIAATVEGKLPSGELSATTPSRPS